MATMTISRSGSINGKSFSDSYTTTSDSGLTLDGVSLPAGKTETLATYSSSSAVTLTVEASHGITTGSTVDVAWTELVTGTLRIRYGCTVGTVSGTSVPIASGGTGDSFTNTVGQTYRVANPVSETFAIPASATKAILVNIPNGVGVVRFMDVSPAVLLAVSRNVSGSTTYIWNTTTDGATSPFGSTAVATILWSNLYSAAQSPVVSVVFAS